MLRFKQQGDDTSLLLLLFLGVVLLPFGMCGLKAVHHIADSINCGLLNLCDS